jgi:hypothetical protein
MARDQTVSPRQFRLRTAITRLANVVGRMTVGETCHAQDLLYVADELADGIDAPTRMLDEGCPNG